MTPQEQFLLNKYRTIQFKLKSAFDNQNTPMYRLYSKELKTVRMTLSILNIHIDGINR